MQALEGDRTVVLLAQSGRPSFVAIRVGPVVWPGSENDRRISSKTKRVDFAGFSVTTSSSNDHAPSTSDLLTLFAGHNENYN